MMPSSEIISKQKQHSNHCSRIHLLDNLIDIARLPNTKKLLKTALLCYQEEMVNNGDTVPKTLEDHTSLLLYHFFFYRYDAFADSVKV